MGSCYSRVEREEAVSRCKRRRRYMKQLVDARQAFSAAHTTYLRSLRATGSALLHFSSSAASDPHRIRPSTLLPPPPARPQQPPPPLSPISDKWTASITTSSSSPLPPPPPPPSTWDFWDPFLLSSSRSVTEEEWETTTTATLSETAAPTEAPGPAMPSAVSACSRENESNLTVVVSTNSKDLGEIVKELDEYFLKAADAGGEISLLLEAPSSCLSNHHRASKVYRSGWRLNPLLWSRNSRLNEVITEGIVNGGGRGSVQSSHSSTVERLYAWEKKLFKEVKNVESLKMEHDRRVSLLRKQEIKGASHLKIEKNKNEIEKLECGISVAAQAIETTSSEIVRLREAELYPQLLELVKGLMCMWRSMYECHQVQTHIVQQLKFLHNIYSGTEPTSEIHRQSTLQLELEVQQWHTSFCKLIKSQQDYIRSLASWLRLSLFQFNCRLPNKTQINPPIFFIAEEWQLALDRIPHKVASEGIKSLLAVVHAVVLQQAEEKKQKKRLEAACRELDRKASSLRSLESKYGPYSVPDNSRYQTHQDSVADKHAKVEMLRASADEEKMKYEKCAAVTKAMTLNNLQTGFPNVFQSMTGFSSACVQAFESVCNKSKNMDHCTEIKGLLT